MRIILGKWTEDKLDRLIHEASKIKDAGLGIGFISEHFLGIPYKESTLIGDANTSEVFVINLEGVDCLTFIEYVEAMQLSKSFLEFKENLRRLRYRRGEVSFKNRNHFFTDWREFNSVHIEDITANLSQVRVVTKRLNLKDNGQYLLNGIKPVEREIKYIPSNTVDDSVIDRLKTGDYIGIYSDLEGLDVSHVGIFIREKGKTYLRHASSVNKYRKVIDQDFKDYISNKPGLVVLRPRD